MMMEEIHQPRMRRARATRLTTRTRLWRRDDSPSSGVLSTTSASASRWGGFCFSLSTEAEERDDYFSGWPLWVEVRRSCSRLGVLLVAINRDRDGPRGKRRR